MISRRKFIQTGALGIGAIVSGACAIDLGLAATVSNDLITEKVIIPIKNLPKEFDDYKIAFLTDPHLGVWVPDQIITSAINIIRAHEPDLFLLGGDYLYVPEDPVFGNRGVIRNEDFKDVTRDSGSPLIIDRFIDLLGGFKGHDGIYSVLGNHDNWVVGPSCKERLEGASIPVLLNRPIELNRGSAKLTVYGTDDYLTGIPRVDSGFINPSSNTVRILLTHNPDMATYLLSKYPNPFELALCGHTHGGQIKSLNFGALTHHLLYGRFGEGLNRSGESQVYTSRGIGYVELPIRLNCPAEITILTLKSA